MGYAKLRDTDMTGKTMMEQPQKSRLSIFLKQHEQWSAWCFFTLMSSLVLYVSGLGWGALLLTPMLGIMMLYVLKICALYVRRSSAWAITGVFFACTPLFTAHVSELSLSLQFVVLYHVMAWARGKRREFKPRHFFIVGLSTGVALTSLLAATVFYVPVVMLMLWVNRGSLIKAVDKLLFGFVLSLWGHILQTWPVCAKLPEPGAQVPLYFLPLLCLLLPAIATVKHNHPERRTAVHIALGTAVIAITAAALSGFCPEPRELLFSLLPFTLLALIGTALLLHKRLGTGKGVALLRGLGIICPFITLCVVLIAPVYRMATAPPPQPTPSVEN